jgi:hypothetical protein
VQQQVARGQNSQAGDELKDKVENHQADTQEHGQSPSLGDLLAQKVNQAIQQA